MNLYNFRTWNFREQSSRKIYLINYVVLKLFWTAEVSNYGVPSSQRNWEIIYVETLLTHCLSKL